MSLLGAVVVLPALLVRVTPTELSANVSIELNGHAWLGGGLLVLPPEDGGCDGGVR